MLKQDTISQELVFAARGLTKVYGHDETAVHALTGVDLDLYAGELVVLLGPSGSGKSTLLNNLGGLDVPTDGSLTYRGQDLTHAKEQDLTRFRRNSVGFVFQFYNLIPSLTARENVALITEISLDPMAPEDALGLVDLGGSHGSFSLAALGRPAAARGHRPRDCEAARSVALR